MAHAGTADFGGVSSTQPKMMKPKPMRNPSRVIILRRKVKIAVIPVAFMVHLILSFQTHLKPS